jgi:hypothetical protein
LSKEHLAIYLNDHLAGSTFALEILDHLATDTPHLATSLAALKNDIEEDREQLRTLIRKLDITESRVRKLGSWIAERLTEVKLEADDDANGPLRRLEILEALAIGIFGKMALWRALKAVPSNEALAGLDYDRLMQRAQEQSARVDLLRLDAARMALTI